MLIVNSSDVESHILSWVRDWFELLAAGQVLEACARLDEPSSYGTVWTPEAIGDLVAETFESGTRFAAEHPDGPEFTSVRAATGRERYDFGPYSDGTGFWVNYDVPLNGAFSDLTAQFEFHWRAPRILATRLQDLHVM
jgi:hypothetical protein